MSSTIPKSLPLDSEKFLAPASCKHKTKNEILLKEENPDRERMVCAIGIDVHYELNVMANETGAFQPRLKPFNPRMSGPACPYNYTGKFVTEKEHHQMSDDPIALGRTIEKVDPYDRELYQRRDPRLVSKTVVVRDYGCKIPIDLVDTEKIAKAVLNHYPDQYVAFLGEFVSNLFGPTMRKFLEGQQVGLQKLIDAPDELNRVSWGAYMAVQGGVDPNKPVPQPTPGQNDRFYEQQLQGDATLRWSDDIANALGGLTKDGRAMTGQCTSQDVYDLRPCLQQHIQTLERMRTTFCRGFGSKEVHVLAMLWYANEQGRKLCHDLQLMAQSEMPQYERVTMQVPVNFFHLDTKEPHTTQSMEPDLNSSIRSSLHEHARTVQWTHTLDYPVGAWSGNAESINVFLKTSTPSPYQWGWGHASNVAMRWTGRENEKGKHAHTKDGPLQKLLVAPHLRYTYDNQHACVRIDQSGAQQGRAYVSSKRWGPVLRQPDQKSQLASAFVSGQVIPQTNLRDSLDDLPEPHPFRGTRKASERLYQGVNTETVQMDITDAIYSTPAPSERPSMKIPAPKTCADPNAFAVINPKYCDPTCDTLDPFLSVGGRCITVKDGKSSFKFGAVGPYDINKISTSSTFTNFLRRTDMILRQSDNSMQATGVELAATIAFFMLTFEDGNTPPKMYECYLLAQKDEAKETEYKDRMRSWFNSDALETFLGPPDADAPAPDSKDEKALKTLFSFLDRVPRSEVVKELAGFVTFEGLQECLTPAAKLILDKASRKGYTTNCGKYLDDYTSTTKDDNLKFYLLTFTEAVSATHWMDEPDQFIDHIKRIKDIYENDDDALKSLQKCKANLLAVLIAHLGMRYWEATYADSMSKADKLNSLYRSPGVKLVQMITAPSTPYIELSSEIVESYKKAQLGKVWPVRTIITGNKVARSIDLPFISQHYRFEEWRKTIPDNVLDMSRFANSLDADVSLSMSNVGSGDNDSDKVAMQIIALRLIIQSSMGMFIGALLCHNPFNMDSYCDSTQLLFPDMNTTIEYPEAGEKTAYIWSSLWERNGWKGCFAWRKATRKLVMYESVIAKEQDVSGAYAMDKKDARAEVLRRVRDAILSRIKIMLSDNKDAKQQMATKLALQIAPYATFDSFDEESTTWRMLNSMSLGAIPSDLFFQQGESTYLDPLLLYASTPCCYKKQWESLKPECKNFLLALKMTTHECTPLKLNAIVRGNGELSTISYPQFLWEDENHLNQSKTEKNPEPKDDDLKEYDFDECMFWEQKARDLYQKKNRDPNVKLVVRSGYDAEKCLLPPHAWDKNWEKFGSDGFPKKKDTLEQYSNLSLIFPSNIRANMMHWWNWIISEFDANKAAITGVIGDIQPTFRGTTFRAASSASDDAAAQALVPTADLELRNEDFLISNDEIISNEALKKQDDNPKTRGGAADGLAAGPRYTKAVAQRSIETDADALYNTPTDAKNRSQYMTTTGDVMAPDYVSKIAYNQSEKFYPVGMFSEVRPLDNDFGAGRFVRGSVVHGDKHIDDDDKGDDQQLLILPVSGAPYNTFSDTVNNGMVYNYNMHRPQFFSVLDAAGLLWHAREFVNPADSNRPKDYVTGQPADMHPWCLGMCETFVRAREAFLRDHKDKLWEVEVKKQPGTALPTDCIGQLCDDSWARYFPLLPHNHELRKELGKIRALDYMWGTLPAYQGGSFSVHNSGAWMPLSMAHQVRLLDSVGLFDHKYRVPRNPWLAHNGQGISRVYNQSYHSVYHTDSYRAPHFREWLKQACTYQKPNKGCFYPFSQYGGTPVQADFVHHRVEKPENEIECRHKQLVYNRFGFHSALRLGQQFHDTGLLQDLYSFKYRQYADLSIDQRAMQEATAIYPSNFMAYARTHSIIALASCNQGTEEVSVPRAVRNLYRLYVDTYECMGANPDDDGVPAVMGFLPSAIRSKEDRPVIMYAGSLSCLNTKLERFCSSPGNKDEKVCQVYKQVYLNDATLLFTRLLRAERRKILHESNYRRALIKRQGNYSPDQFRQDLIELQDAYIDFLQTTVIGMLLENGADLNNAPLHLLEPRELEVSMLEEDDNVVGNDYLTPRTSEILQGMDFNGDTLSRTQLAILSLIPPNHRILGTLRLNQSTEIIDLEHAKKQIQRETIDSNKKVWQRYSEALIAAAFGQKLLEVDGPIDFGYDMSEVKDPNNVRFKPSDIKDPLRESENIKERMSTSHAQASSSLSQTIRGETMRNEYGPESVLGMNSAELARALKAVRERVDRDFQRNAGNIPRIKCLAMLRIPEHIKRMLRNEYE